MKKFYFIIAVLTTSITFSQQMQAGRMSAQTERQFLDIINKSRNTVTLKDSEIVGTKYFNENFVPGKIAQNNVEFSKEFQMRYNAYADEIEVNNGVDIDVLAKDSSISCTIGEQQYNYLPYKEANSEFSKMGYLTILFEGKNLQLYKREVKIFKEGRKARTSLTTSIPPKLVDFEHFVISQNNETPSIIKLKEKVLLNLFPEELRPKLKQYLKENKLKLKNKSDLISFIAHCDNLISKS